MTALKLIVENDFRDFDVILEQENPESIKKLKIRGPYIVSEQKNANGRTYRKSIMESAVNDFKRDFIETGRALGELNHPTHTEIDQKQACHRIIDLVEDGNSWIGTSLVLCSSQDGKIRGTPNGDILASIIQYGGKPGMSTRGVGSINESNVVDAYKMITVDCVSSPSGPGCFINGILESKNFMIDVHGDIIEASYNTLEKNLEKLPRHIDEKNEFLVSVIRSFIESI